MINSLKNKINLIADFYRTAPLGESFFVLNAGFMAVNYDRPLVFGLNLFATLGCVMLTKTQFDLRKRLENSVTKHGYDERVFETTISEWCDRQTARVVAKNYGYLEEYVSLYESNKDRISFPNLRNF